MVRKKVIMQVIPSMNEGGAERFVVDLCNALSEKDSVEVHLVLFFDLNEHMFLSKEINSSVHVHTLGKTLGFDYKVLYRFSSLVNNIKPDIINTHLGAFEYTLLARIKNSSIRFFHTLHSDAFKECVSSKKRKLRRLFYKNSKFIPVTISDESSSSYKEAYGLDNDVTIYNGRSALQKSSAFEDVTSQFINQFRITEKTKVIVNVGRISEPKNQLLLAKATNQLIEEGEDIVLLIIGGSRPETQDIFESIKKE